MSDTTEQAALLALVARSDGEWHKIAAAAEEMGSALSLLSGTWTGFESFDTQAAEDLSGRIRPEDIEAAGALIETYVSKGITLRTVLDADYPPNLRQVYNRPPFLFVKGKLLSEDDRSVAVVGTRKASPGGIEDARSLATQLVEHGITVLSGLAAGIDSAAHQATLDAGGRTVAVMGTGIDRIYPKSNERLASEILESGGALVSQFWPDAPPTKYSFPMRNVVMSGMAIGTAVIEANHRSGAKMQARLALEHGKRLFLPEGLVEQEEWAKRYAKDGKSVVVRSVDDILPVITATIQPPKQLSLR